MVSCCVHVLKLYRTKVLCGSVVFVDVLFLWIGSVFMFYSYSNSHLPVLYEA